MKNFFYLPLNKFGLKTFESIHQSLFVVPTCRQGQSEEGVGGIEPGGVTVGQSTKKTVIHRAIEEKRITINNVLAVFGCAYL